MELATTSAGAAVTSPVRCPGITVDEAHVLASPGMTRENFYVAVTLGRPSNHLGTAPDAVDPMGEHLPGLHGPRRA